MKKILLTLALVMCGCEAFAKGYLSVETRYFQQTASVRPVVGFGIYEKLFKDGSVAYNSWSGYGQPDSMLDMPEVHWYVTRHALDFVIGDFTLSPGFQINFIDLPTKNQRQDAVFVKIAYKLWN
jgi:hypothetical protein